MENREHEKGKDEKKQNPSNETRVLWTSFINDGRGNA